MAIPLEELLAEMVQSDGSDLIVASGFPPALRVQGRLDPSLYGELAAEEVEALLREILLPVQYRRLIQEQSLDFAHECDLPGLGVRRFRGNAFLQRHGYSVVFRLIPTEVPTIEELGLPVVLKTLCHHHNGLILVTGVTGSGKSTTLAAMTRYLNETSPVHIITIEDPIEYVYTDHHAIIVQRQVQLHVSSFQRALRAALREDPDVILVGEMRDLETVQLALTAAETGHLVMATLHTHSAAQTISRVVSTFPHEQRQQVLTMLADSLRGVISQQLLPRADRWGRVAAVELLLATDAVSNLIRENRLHQIPGIIETNRQRGMQLMDQHLHELVTAGIVEPAVAYERAHDKVFFHDLMSAGREVPGWN